MTVADLLSIFEPVVEKILLCVAEHLNRAVTIEGYVEAPNRKILLAGGFGNSGYLVFRLNQLAEANGLELVGNAFAHYMV